MGSIFGTKPSGGDGGGAEREAARQSRINNLKSDIRKNFFVSGNEPTPERLQRFEDIENRTRDFFTPQFEEDVKTAQRELNFALARRGTFGGSAQIDAEKRLQDKIALGEREIGQRVIGARTEAERLDNQLLDNLLNQANSDSDAAGVLGGIRSSQIANTDQALSRITSQQLGQTFDNVGTLFKDINDTAAFNNAAQQGAQLAALLGKNNNPFIAGTTSSNSGRVTGA
jgi:hypothetical protein